MSRDVFKAAGIAALGFATYGVGFALATGTPLAVAAGTSIGTLLTSDFDKLAAAARVPDNAGE